MSKRKRRIVIIGAGPAGLGCGYELSAHLKEKNIEVLILEKNKSVGGLARTQRFLGYNFDVGPHRFYTKNEQVLKLWKTVLKSDFVVVKRLTSILYRNKYFVYPIQLRDVMSKLGFLESAKIGLSYLEAKLFIKPRPPKTLEDWVTRHFGKKLYTMFFKTYNEKVWGIPCEEIGAEWAAQRIKNLSLSEIVRTAIFGQKKRKAKSLVNLFHYPKKGAGQMYEKMASIIKRRGIKVLTDCEVVSVSHCDSKISVVTYRDNGRLKKVNVDFLFSSMPLTGFVQTLNPKSPSKVINAAKKLYYRDHVTVNLLVKNSGLFKENWIYVHSPEVMTARVSNYNNFEKDRGSNKKYAAIAVEYFSFRKDTLWNMSDEELIDFAIKELGIVQIISPEMVVNGFVIREVDSYPTYYLGHKPYYDLLKEYVMKFKNLELIGRGGMYKYNNMDHSIYSGILAARNFLHGERLYDVWSINEDAMYLEEK